MSGLSDARMEGYSTHQALLVHAATRTTGPIWELGCGHYSTPILHAISGGWRPVFTLDKDPTWLAYFAAFTGPWHRLVAVQDWEAALRSLREESGHAGLCFIDNAPCQARELAVRLLRGAVDVCVCHDTQERPEVMWGGSLDGFRFACEDRRYTPWTRAVSDTVDVRAWAEVIPKCVVLGD